MESQTSFSPGEGRFTKYIYTSVQNNQFTKLLELLKYQLQCNPRSREAMSLLAYCYWHLEQYERAAGYYELLMKGYPQMGEYQLYFAQCLYRGAKNVSQLSTALKVCQRNSNPKLESQFLQLQAAIKLEQEDLQGSKVLVAQMVKKDAVTIANEACLLYKDEKYEDATVKYREALELGGERPSWLYYLALCSYRMKNYAVALNQLDRIVQMAKVAHPELEIQSRQASDPLPDHSVGNSSALCDSFVIESLNLACAIHYRLRDYHAADQKLADMPPRFEDELEAEVLHNAALVSMELHPTVEDFEKLKHLVSASANPPEALSNLLLLYVRNRYYDYVLDIIGSNAQEVQLRVSSDTRDLIEAIVLQSTSLDSAYAALEQLNLRLMETLRKLDRSIQDPASTSNQDGKLDEDLLKRFIRERENTMESYLPVLMAQAKILWDTQEFVKLEALLLRSAEFCRDQEAWMLNFAHCLFRLEDRESDALVAYESFVRTQSDKPFLKIQAIVLANMCVLLCILSRNDEAENIMQQIELEEQAAAEAFPDEPTFHLCIVNLVIGTLYCVRNNYAFGILRIIKAFEPFERRLGPTTWLYAKRCFVSLFEKLARHLLVLDEATHLEVLKFFDNAELYGKKVSTNLDTFKENAPKPPMDKVSYDARLLKYHWLQVFGS